MFLQNYLPQNKIDMNKIYISGKISRIENEASIHFQRAEIQLELQGFKPVNPMKLNHDHDKSWSSFMRVDIKALCECESIYMLKNWQESKGAKMEKDIATELGMLVIFED
jgi:hypothetical protein